MGWDEKASLHYTVPYRRSTERLNAADRNALQLAFISILQKKWMLVSTGANYDRSLNLIHIGGNHIFLHSKRSTPAILLDGLESSRIHVKQ
jgi:hypothetical protein